MIGSAVIRRLRRVRQEERGVVFVLVAICMVFMLGIVGLAVDIGSWYQTQRQAQAAADAAALAGSQDLPGSPTAASTDANAYVNKNIAGATIGVLTPYLSSSSTVQVTVSVKASIFFAKIFGFSAPTVTATAAATANPSVAGDAVFAYDSNCQDSSLKIDGGAVTGNMHSNGSLWMDEGNTAFGPTTYGGPNGCTPWHNGSGDTYNGATSPTIDSALEPWPEPYTLASIPCGTMLPANYDFSTSGQVLSGVYCETAGVLSMDGANLSGSATFIAAQFNLNNASGDNFTPAYQNLLFGQTGSNALNIDGGGFLQLGTVYAPNAFVELNSGSSPETIRGFIEANTVTINASNVTLVGSGPGTTSGGSALVQ